MYEFRLGIRWYIILYLVALQFVGLKAGGTVSGTGNEGFTFVKVNKKRADAKQHCLNMGKAGLAIVDTLSKREFITDISKDYEPSKRFWIGLIQTDTSNPKKETFLWESASASSWVDWHPQEPQATYLPYKQCALMTEFGKTVHAEKCDQLAFSICQDPEPNTRQTTTPTTTSTTPMPTPAIQDTAYGYYPLIHADYNIKDPHLATRLFSDVTRSEIECVRICNRSPYCRTTIFSTSSQHCETYSFALETQTYILISQTGTYIRQRK